MSGIVAPELDASHLLLLVEVDRLNLVHGSLQVAVREQLLVRRDVGHLDVVAEHPEEDGFGGVGHEAFAAEGGFLEEPGQGAGVVQVEVRDEKEVDLRINLEIRDKKYIFSPDRPRSCRQKGERPSR